jgi:anthranilate synthase component 1
MLIKKQFPDREEYTRLVSQKNVIPICAEILADTETPVSILRKFHENQGPVFLFESVEGGERWGRYSFLSASARCHVRVFSEQVVVEEKGVKTEYPHHGDPLTVLKELMAQYQPAQIEGLPRFWGGLVGYMTYEMVAFFEAIPNRLPAAKPIAHFIIPDQLLIFDNIRHTLLLVAICFLNNDYDPQQAYEKAGDQIKDLMEKIEMTGPAKAPRNEDKGLALKAVFEDEVFKTGVSKVKEYIVAGDIIQAVISQPFTCSPSPDLWSLYRAQRYINPSPYLFFLHLDHMALVGSSPETMVRLENRIATLRPIAGTRPRGKNEQQDRALSNELLSDEKERAEHLMLVDLGRNDLGRVAETGTVQVTDLMIVERYSHVMHLVSNISCDLKPEYDAWDLLRATFPAGTLSGAPKVRAMEIIAEMEQGPRGPYGGAVGYVSFSGNMDLAITIRTACIEDNVLTVRAGAGIVADSDPERERVETQNKAMAIQKALQLLQK